MEKTKNRNLLFGLLVASCLVRLSLSFEQRADCVDNCAHLDTSHDFGDCLHKCSKRPKKDTSESTVSFASPPTDLHISTEVVIDGGKILETKIKWKADEYDQRREGFYIKYTAANSTCQKTFPGFFSSSIGPDERSLTIPAAFNGHALVVDHSCTYILQIRSKPYPPGDDSYTLEKSYTVPHCIRNYCRCNPGDVPVISDVRIGSGYLLNWKFEGIPGKQYQFYVDVYERMSMPLIKTAESTNFGGDFTFQLANSEPFEVSSKKSQIGPSNYHFPIPYPFVSKQQYKISLFAVDESFCHNEDVFHVFNSTIEMGPELGAEDHVFLSGTFSGATISHTKVVMDSSVLLVFLIIALCVSPICTLCAIFLVKRRRQGSAKRRNFIQRRSLSCSRHSIIETNILYRSPNEVNGTGDWLIRGQDIVVGTVIGEGAFGQVFKGILRGPNGQVVPVAVKQLKANAIDEEKEEFIREIEMMQTIGQHDNIVSMYGYCMDEHLQCMIMEYVPYGDLKHYLQNMRKEQEPETGVQLLEFLSFADQVARGMSHLESVGIIHRDLAARNILVGTGKVLKISDFGMSRPGVYIKMSKGVIPLRWLSPEAVKDNIYSNKSDVWAYGVLLWEISTLGGFPYNNIADKDILKELTDGNRLEKPKSCSLEMYNLMKSCWKFDPEERPSFSSVLKEVDRMATAEADSPPSDPTAYR